VTENESRKKDKEIDPVITEMEDQTTWFNITEKDQESYRRKIDNTLTIRYLVCNIVNNTFTLLH
jgi:hypothetical protein